MSECNETAADTSAPAGGTLVRCLEEIQQPDHRPSSVSTWKAEIKTEAGNILLAAVKPLTPKRLANEFAVAIVAKQLGVSCPTTFVISDPDDMWPDPNQLASDRRLFGSEFVALAAVHLATFPEKSNFIITEAFAKTLLLDLLVNNIDRVDRNLLIDGEKYYAIDHDKSFGGEAWSLDSLTSPEEPRSPTHLESLLMFAMCAKADLEALAQKWSETTIDVGALSKLTGLDQVDIAAISTFVTARLKVMPKLLRTAFDRSA